ncbi:MAG: hypothetical protein ACR2HN_11000 [Tepidiformaceae bacterium]
MAEPGSAREAAERNAEAVMAGNLAQIMADITPDALAQMMQMAAAAGGINPAALPGITAYEVAEAGAEGDAETFNVTFISPAGRATLSVTWKPVIGQWKIAAVALGSAAAAQAPAD